MEGNTWISLFFSGLCFLPACFPHFYILVETEKTWDEAQSYCRKKYTDLASVDNQEESEKLQAAAQNLSEAPVWIGLYDDINSWRWSLENQTFYGKGEKDFRNWSTGEPNNLKGHEICGAITSDAWRDLPCDWRLPFVCYNETPSSFIFVKGPMNWRDAQSYCRKHHTDLASVRNQTENDQINKIIQSDSWIGLYRNSWKWSDGSPYSFRNWQTDRPNDGLSTPCVSLRQGRWEDLRCDTKANFVCQADALKQQVFRLKVTQKDSSMDLESAAEDILQQLRQSMQDFGLSPNMKLTWRKQPDGKIFSLEDKEEEEEEKISCT